VRGGLDAAALDCASECGNAPVLHLVVEDSEGWLLVLDDVDAGGFELERFLVEDRGELPRHSFCAEELGSLSALWARLRLLPPPPLPESGDDTPGMHLKLRI